MCDKTSSKDKIIIIPDSFKGTMSAIEVCEIISAAVRDRYPAAQISAIPMADGGEGTCEAFHYALGGEMIPCEVHGPYMESMMASYWKKEQTAVIELAAAAGFITDPAKRDPSVTTTYGAGEQIAHAIQSGCSRIILGLGGSCTNDAGVGIASALGAKFMNEQGNEFLPTGNSLGQIRHMDLSQLQQTINGVRFDVMCDVDNPLYGPQGAAYVYAPQKGADEEMVRALDLQLQEFATLVEHALQIDLSQLPGGGAAGGAGAGAFVFLNASLRRGAEIVLEMNGFDEVVQMASAVITGEGQLDGQSLCGKVVMTVASHAKTCDVPVFAVVGNTSGDYSSIYDLGVKKVIRTIDYCNDPHHYEKTCKQDLYQAVIGLDLIST